MSEIIVYKTEAFNPKLVLNASSMLTSIILCYFLLLSLCLSPLAWRNVWEEAEGMMGEGLVWIRRFIKQVWWGKVGLIPEALRSKAYLGHRALRHKQLAAALAGGAGLRLAEDRRSPCSSDSWASWGALGRAPPSSSICFSSHATRESVSRFCYWLQ